MDETQRARNRAHLEASFDCWIVVITYKGVDVSDGQLFVPTDEDSHDSVMKS